jgi:hypothetical protein
MYEVSSTASVRNIKTQRKVPQNVDWSGKDQRRKVILMRGEFPVESFVDEVLYNEFPELRGLAA